MYEFDFNKDKKPREEEVEVAVEVKPTRKKKVAEPKKKVAEPEVLPEVLPERAVPTEEDKELKKMYFDYLNPKYESEITWYHPGGNFPTLEDCQITEDVEYVKANTHPRTANLPRKNNGEVDWYRVDGNQDPLLGSLKELSDRASVTAYVTPPEPTTPYREVSISDSLQSNVITVSSIPTDLQIPLSNVFLWASDIVAEVSPAVNAFGVAPEAMAAWTIFITEMKGAVEAGILVNDTNQPNLSHHNVGIVNSIISRTEQIPYHVINSITAEAAQKRDDVVSYYDKNPVNITPSVEPLFNNGVIKVGNQYMMPDMVTPYTGTSANGMIVVQGVIMSPEDIATMAEQRAILQRSIVANPASNQNRVPTDEIVANFGTRPSSNHDRLFDGVINQSNHTGVPYEVLLAQQGLRPGQVYAPPVSNKYGGAAQTAAPQRDIYGNIINAHPAHPAPRHDVAAEQLCALYGIPQDNYLDSADIVAKDEALNSLKAGRHPNNGRQLDNANTYHWNDPI